MSQERTGVTLGCSRAEHKERVHEKKSAQSEASFRRETQIKPALQEKAAVCAQWPSWETLRGQVQTVRCSAECFCLFWVGVGV